MEGKPGRRPRLTKVWEDSTAEWLSMSFLPNNHFALWGWRAEDEVFLLYNLTNGQKITELAWPKTGAYAFAMTRDAAIIAELEHKLDGLTIRDGKSGEQLTNRGLESPSIDYRAPWQTHSHYQSPLILSAISFSPSRPLLAIGTDEGRVVLLDIASGQTRALRAQLGRIKQLAFSPDGRILASISEVPPLF